jgi:hypothetical protein
MSEREFLHSGNKEEKPKPPHGKSDPPIDARPNRPRPPRKKHEPMHIRKKEKIKNASGG